MNTVNTIKEAIELLNKQCHPAGFHVAMVRMDKLEFNDLFGGDTDGDTPHDLMVQTYDWRYGMETPKEEYEVKLTGGNMRYIGRAIETYEQVLNHRYEKELKEVFAGMAAEIHGESEETG